MSVSLAVGQVKSQADLIRKEMDYRKYLQLQARLNSNAEKAAQLPIEPPLLLATKTDDGMEVNAIRGKVQERLTSLIGEKEAEMFLGRYMLDQADLQMFSSVYDEFYPVILRDRPVNANYLYNVYNRWLKLRKAKKDTMSGGAMNASLDPTIQTEMNRVGEGIKGVILNSGLSPMDTLKYVKQVENAMRMFDYATLEKMAGKKL